MEKSAFGQEFLIVYLRCESPPEMVIFILIARKRMQKRNAFEIYRALSVVNKRSITLQFNIIIYVIVVNVNIG